MQASPLKLTPSSLAYGLDCPRCFYLQARRGLAQPRMPFPRVFEKYHKALQDYFTGRCPSHLAPTLPTGQCVARETWTESAPIVRPGHEATPVFFKGRLDHLLQFDDGTYGIVDYKTVEIGMLDRRRYAWQLHAYAWSLEQAAPGAVRIGKISRLGLLCLEPVRLSSYAHGESAEAELRPVWVEVERRDDAFGAFLDRVIGLLERAMVPAPSASCPTCTYLTRRHALRLT